MRHSYEKYTDYRTSSFNALCDKDGMFSIGMIIKEGCRERQDADAKSKNNNEKESK